MSQPTNFRLVLTGPYVGQTKFLNGYWYVDGVLDITDTPENMEGLILYMGKSYQAFLEGSDEHKAAQQRDAIYCEEELAKEAENGERDTHGTDRPEHTVQGSDNSLEGKVQPAGRGSAEVPPVDGASTADNPTGTEGSISSGDGHENTGLSDTETGSGGIVEPTGTVDPLLEKAILSLDPSVKEHWIADGRPAMAAVEASFGSADVTRRDVEAAVPDWNRDKSQEIAELKALTD